MEKIYAIYQFRKGKDYEMMSLVRTQNLQSLRRKYLGTNKQPYYNAPNWSSAKQVYEEYQSTITPFILEFIYD